eukprot:TRINITY_DN2728_c0_g1_i15.p1 TRINITY_DN2728_c0_g1~~TRINITY_DN2728_c0_g1_i15.p1  ORF type:complete len:938 (-),score=252.83 TRINITY_DN2728_c0_g1_i15:142-2955(-)
MSDFLLDVVEAKPIPIIPERVVETPLSPTPVKKEEELNVFDLVQTHYKSSVAVHRLSLARKLPTLMEQMKEIELLELIPPIISEISRDVEAGIRQALCEQFGVIGGIYKKKFQTRGTQFIIRILLPLVEKLLTDDTATVREAALAVMMGLSGLLEEGQLEAEVLPIVDRLANSEEEEYRVEASQLLNDLSPLMSRRQVTEFSMKIIQRFSCDDMFRVRKGVASNVHQLCESLGTDNVTLLLLPIYCQLSEDEIWGVRKACADSLASFSRFVTPIERTNRLVPLFLRLVEDSSRWVKSAALQSLGPFIATFGNSPVPQILVDHFKWMAKAGGGQGVGQDGSDLDLTFNCAFNFPAVLNSLGSDAWSELVDTYVTLTKDPNVKVRQTLSYSLHTVANILGERMTERMLLTTMNDFFSDLDEVKVGVITNLAKFLEIVSPNTRKQYLPKIEAFSTKTGNISLWRHRKLIAKQFGSIALLFDAQIVVSVLLPVFYKLREDCVASVRKALASQVGHVIKSLKELEVSQKEFLVDLVKLSEPTTSYQQRIWFTRVCPFIFKELSTENFTNYFLSSLEKLVHDITTNVRVAVALALKELLPTFGPAEKLLRNLSMDSDRDVAGIAKMILDASPKRDLTENLKASDELNSVRNGHQKTNETSNEQQEPKQQNKVNQELKQESNQKVEQPKGDLEIQSKRQSNIKDPKVFKEIEKEREEVTKVKSDEESQESRSNEEEPRGRMETTKAEVREVPNGTFREVAREEELKVISKEPLILHKEALSEKKEQQQVLKEVLVEVCDEEPKKTEMKEASKLESQELFNKDSKEVLEEPINKKPKEELKEEPNEVLEEPNKKPNMVLEESNKEWKEEPNELLEESSKKLEEELKEDPNKVLDEPKEEPKEESKEIPKEGEPREEKPLNVAERPVKILKHLVQEPDASRNQDQG